MNTITGYFGDVLPSLVPADKKREKREKTKFRSIVHLYNVHLNSILQREQKIHTTYRVFDFNNVNAYSFPNCSMKHLNQFWLKLKIAT